RQHHHRQAGVVVGDRRSRGDPVAGHLDVEQADVRLLLGRGLDRASGVARLGHDLEPGPLERGLHARARRSMVIGEDYPDLPFLGYGSSTSILVPAPGDEVTRKSAPSARARSLMLVRPKPPPSRAAGSKPMPSSPTLSLTPFEFESSIVTTLAWPWRAVLLTATRTILISASRVEGSTSIPSSRSSRSRTPTRPATSSAACATAASSGSSIGRVSAEIALRDSSRA